MAVKVAINGFGRIGRLAFRQMFEADGYEVVAINDLTSPAMLAHLLKYDTAQGSFLGKIGEHKHTVEAGEDYIVVDGKKITIYAIKDAKDCPWGELGIDVVLECTGFYTSKDKAMAHVQAGAKKVVISAPAGKDLKTIVYSVNEKTLTKDDQVIVNELAPRPHNSGHYTIEACSMDQFDAHIRGIAGWPLPKPKLLSPAVMVNVLGQHVEPTRALIATHPEWNVHDYGKAEVRHDRKMGHITVLTDDPAKTVADLEATGCWDDLKKKA